MVVVVLTHRLEEKDKEKEKEKGTGSPGETGERITSKSTLMAPRLSKLRMTVISILISPPPPLPLPSAPEPCGHLFVCLFVCVCLFVGGEEREAER